MDVTLHLGAHRTAATTFQRMLALSGAGLGGAGIAAWGPDRVRADLLAGAFAPAAAPLPWARGDRADGRVALAFETARLGGTRRLLLSDARLLGGLKGCLAARSLYPDAAPRLARLARLTGERVRCVGLAIRSYDSWWASTLAASVPRSGPAPTPALVAALARQPRRWRDVIGEVAAAFPDARIAVWTHEAMSARPERVAEALLGPGLPRLSGARDWHAAQPTPAALRTHLADAGAGHVPVREAAGRFMPFGPAERRRLQAAYAGDVDWLRAGAGPRIDYIDDLGADPGATGRQGGWRDDEDTRSRRLG